MKKTILNVLTTIEDGGLEMLVYRIYRGLDPSKYNLKLVSLTKLNGNFLENDFRKLGTEIIEFDFRNKGKGPGDLIHNVYQYFEFVKFLVRTDFDVIHSHDFFPALVTRTGLMLSLKKFGRKTLKVYSTYHNIYYWLKPIHHKINKFLSRITDRIVCVSGSVKKDSVEKEKIAEEKYKVIYNGIEETEFYHDGDLRKNARMKLGFADGDFIIGNVAVLSERKGQLTLLEAFNKISGKHPAAKLLLLGGVRSHEEDYRDLLKKYISDNSMEERVVFKEPVRNVNEVYNALDLFVMPSVTEGFGLSAFEAMLTEKICLFSDIAPFLELVDDRKNGFIFRVSDPDSLAELLDYVLSDYQNLKSMEKVSREHVIERYSLKNMVREYDKLYSAV